MLGIVLIAVLLGVPVGEGRLAIASFAQVRTDIVGSVPVSITLRNDTAASIRLWTPTNYEGMVSVRFLVKDAQGKERPYQPPVPPRAAGVATSVELGPGKTLKLAVVDLGGCRAKLGLPAGSYEIVALYHNELRDRAPTFGVWTGTLRSKPVRIKL